MQATQEGIGIDVGGVIMDRANDDTDTSFFSDNYLRTTTAPGAIEAIARLVAERFKDRSFVVSKCGARIEAKTRSWMAHHRFHERTGIPPERLRFCRTREEKGPICAELGLTHFVDDRLEVLGYLATVPHRYLFNPGEAEVERHRIHLPRVRRVRAWDEIVRDLLPPRL